MIKVVHGVSKRMSTLLKLQSAAVHASASIRDEREVVRSMKRSARELLGGHAGGPEGHDASS